MDTHDFRDGVSVRNSHKHSVPNADTLHQCKSNQHRNAHTNTEPDKDKHCDEYADRHSEPHRDNDGLCFVHENRHDYANAHGAEYTYKYNHANAIANTNALWIIHTNEKS